MNKKTLIIVESPAKSNTISRYLGKNFIVSSSMGHIRDLSPKVLSIDIKNNYKPYYEELKDKKHIIIELKKLSKKVERILLAPDPDREGEAIAFHLSELLKDSNSNIYRILFNEITKQAIKEAINNLLKIDINKVNSQQMRRLLDRLAGYKISPVLHRKMGGPLSAGRVQSIALKLIVEREKEIQIFKPEEYWIISAELEGSKKPLFITKLEKYKNKKIKISNREQSDEVLKCLKKNNFILYKIKKKLKNKRPFAPLITSTLQQEAFRKFKFPVKKTMRIAQKLYEGVDLRSGEVTGLITYMRTDSYRISYEAKKSAKEFILKNFGENYYPDKPNYFGTKKKIQDAHETIRPTLPLRRPDDIKSFLNDNQYKIYKLIWNRFLASQMKEAKIEETVFEISNSDYLFISRGEVIKFPGHLELLKLQDNIDHLPELNEGEILKPVKIIPKQNFTNPPSRYTEASLVKVLDEKGIGRPSTYASIIDTLGKREYVYKKDKKFIPGFLGIKVVEYLEENFSDIMNYNFTAELEKELDLVSEGKLDWVEGVDNFYTKLRDDLNQAKDSNKINLFLGEKCPVCKRELVQKYSHKTRGWFIGCTGYPECKYTDSIKDSDSTIKKHELIEKKCPDCGKNLVKRYSNKTKRYFIGCTGYPECNYIASKEESKGKCPVCSKPLIKRFSKKTRRYFIGCTGYPKCTYIESKKTK